MITLDNIEQLINTTIPAPPACWYKINRRWRDIKAIVWHYTGVPNQTAKSNVQYYASTNRGDNKVGAHYFVDDSTIYSSTPWDQQAGHCGGAGVGVYKNKYNNSNTIGIEVCPHNDSGQAYPPASDPNWYFSGASMDLLTALTAWLLVKIRDDGGDAEIVRHYDITGKLCPAPFVQNPEIYKQCQKAAYQMADMNHKAQDTNPVPSETYPKWVGKVVVPDYLSVRCGAGIEHPLLAEFPKFDNGNLMDITDEAIAKDGITWYKVIVPSGNYGWVSSLYVEASDSFVGEVNTAVDDPLNVRTSPKMDKNIFKQYPKLYKGNLIRIIGEAGDFYRIRIADKYNAYAGKTYIDKK